MTAIIERLRTAADNYMDCTFEEGCRCIYCAAVAEIESLQQQVDTVRHLVVQASGLLLYPHHQDALIDCQHALRQALEAVEMTVIQGGKNGSEGTR